MTLKNNEIIKEAISLKDTYKDIYKLVNEKNIIIIYNNHNNDKFKACTYENIIFLNSNIENYQKEFVLAHELAHFLFHDNNIRHFSKFETLKSSKEELQANLFATVFLGYRYQYNLNNCPIQKIVNYIHCNFLNNYIDIKEID
ncbi:ImmA/IrrE family metallo-endopeptidase [Streptobacillus moniliformis]|uniref:ImmA/IrrE family metallo-endopeptidase n=1 Tax=Streptobacillus moniliformis TaxID=34105 RepID=UPI0007E3880B|nr:ImmA/IrrE family metallo-endopeptidase [Streptobacillus moniliformis]